MGLSSSQARLLSLTGRMHDIEYKAQKLEAQKLQMANESAHVYREYEDALNKTKIQQRYLNSDGSTEFRDATYRSLLDAGYYIQFADNNILWGKNGKRVDGKIGVQQPDIDNFTASGGNIDLFVAKQLNIAGAAQISTAHNTNGYKEIYSAEQLATITGSGNYILMADIDMTGKDWTPKSFSGTLDGNGHTIRGLKNSLFESLDGAKIENLNLDVDITSDAANLGALAQTTKGNTNISNVSVTGNIVSTNTTGTIAAYGCVGGIIGKAGQKLESGTTKLTNVTSTVNISQTGTGFMSFGGLVGDGYRTTIKNSIYNGDITAIQSKYLGGIAGELGENSTVDNCLAKGTINANSTDSGYAMAAGLVGGFYNGSISNCKSDMDVTGIHAAGAVIGTGNFTISDTYITGSVTSTRTDKTYAYATGIAGSPGINTKIKNCIADCDINYVSKNNSNAGLIATNIHGTDTSSGTTTIQNVTTNCNVTCQETGTVTNLPRYTLANGGTGICNDVDPTAGADTSVYTACTATGASTTVNQTLNTPEAQEQRQLYNDMSTRGYYLDIGETTPAAGYEDDSSYLTNLLTEGFLFLFKIDSNTGDEYQVNIATDTNLQEVSDPLYLKKAEAKYEADMRKINNKDKKYDTELAALESERNAIKTEMDTLKTVAKDNVDRTFKLFS